MQFLAEGLVRKVIIVAEQIFQVLLNTFVRVLCGRRKKASEENLYAFENRKIRLYLFGLIAGEYAISKGKAFAQEAIEIVAWKGHAIDVLRNLLSALLVIRCLSHHAHDVE